MEKISIRIGFILLLLGIVFYIPAKASDPPEAFVIVLDKLAKAIEENDTKEVFRLKEEGLGLAADKRDSVLFLFAYGDSVYEDYRDSLAVSAFSQLLSVGLDSPYLDFQVHYRMAISFIALGNEYEGKRNYRKTISKARQFESRLAKEWTGNSLISLGQIYIQKGDTHTGIVLYRQALDISKSIDGRNDIRERSLIELGTALSTDGAKEEALKYFNTLLQLGCEDSSYLGVLYTNLGELFQESGDLEKAIDYCRKAERVFLAKKEIENVAQAHASLADAYLAQEDLSRAYTTILQAIAEYKQAVGPDRTLGKMYLTLGEIYEAENEYEKAAEQYQQALNTVLNTPISPSPFENPHPDSLHEENVFQDALTFKGRAFTALYRETGEQKYLQAAFEAYSLAMHADDKLRLVFSPSSTTEFITGETHWRTDSLLNIAWQLHQAGNINMRDTVFALMEHSRSMDLLAKQVAGQAEIKANIPIERKMALDDLKEAYASCVDEHGESACSTQITAYNNFIERLDDDYPGFREKRKQIPLPSLKNVVSRLEEDEQLIEYFWGAKGLFAVSIKKNSQQWKYLGSSADIEQLLKEGMDWDAPIPKQAKALNTLHKVLLEPFGELKKSLILIPDGSLHALSFDMLLQSLPREEKMNDDFWKSDEESSGADYLLKDHSIRYANAASMIFGLDKGEKGKGKVVFSPVYSDDASYQGRAVLPLHYSEDDVGGLDDFQKFLGPDASKATFLSQASRFDWIYLVLHGFTDTSDSDKSCLAFADASGEVDPLNVARIYGMSLKASLVVLFSCETGKGRYQAGEGTMSTARAFRYAGADAVLMSKWNAELGSGKVIMKAFFEHLESKGSKAEALRSAKLDFLRSAKRRNAHPRAWANFMLVGIDEVPKSSCSGMCKMAIAMAGLVVVAFLGWVLLRIRKKSVREV